jgi:tetratricopeptide (TPR) repeat protein
VIASALPVYAQETGAELARRCLDRAGDAAVQACRQALAAAPPPARAAALRHVLAVRLAELKRAEEVVDVYREAVRARPSDADAQQRLGRALFHLAGRPADAEGPLQEAVRLRPTDPAAHTDLAVVLAALGRMDEAVKAFEEAARLDPGHFESRPAARATLEAARRGQRWP